MTKNVNQNNEAISTSTGIDYVNTLMLSQLRPTSFIKAGTTL